MDQIVEGGEGLFQRRGGVGFVHEQQIQVVYSQTSQALIDLVENVAP